MAKIVLVLEDDPRIALVEKTLLMKAGYEVLHAKSAREAIELAAEHEIAILISDLMMPNWDGRMAIKAVMQGKPELKVIVVSAVSDPNVRTNMEKNLPNIAAWIEKPFEGAVLLARVKAAIGEP